MLDGIVLERKGTPAAVILTDRFEVNGRQMVEIQGAQGFGWAVTAHPIANKPDEELRRAALTLVPVLLSHLTTA